MEEDVKGLLTKILENQDLILVNQELIKNNQSIIHNQNVQSSAETKQELTELKNLCSKLTDMSVDCLENTAISSKYLKYKKNSGKLF